MHSEVGKGVFSIMGFGWGHGNMTFGTAAMEAAALALGRQAHPTLHRAVVREALVLEIADHGHAERLEAATHLRRAHGRFEERAKALAACD